MFGHSKWNSKRGSTIIFLTMITVSMAAAAIVLVQAAKEISEVSYSDAVLNIGGRSVLAEFDRRLKSDYGIFAFKGDETTIQSKINFYYKENFKHGKMLFHPQKINTQVLLKEYSILDVDNFEKEIVTAAKYNFFMPGSKGKETFKEGKGILKNDGVIQGLPSNEYAQRGLNMELIEFKESFNMNELISEKGNEIFVNSYIFSVFNHRLYTLDQRETFFRYEIEYLLSGKLSDSANIEQTEKYIVRLRTAVNIGKIYKDPVRSAKALAIAETLTPGPAAVATQFVIISGWALIEAKKEKELIVSGEEVDNLGYKEYLKIFLCMEDRETKILRIMDLIQINLKGTYYSDFLLQEHYIGFYFDSQINGRHFSYEEKY